jgi:hypothetical protein
MLPDIDATWFLVAQRLHDACAAQAAPAVLFGWRADNFATAVQFDGRQESSEPKHRVAHQTPNRLIEEARHV